MSASPHGMVYALMAEFDVHRTHFATFLNFAKPGVVTRLLLLSTQVWHVPIDESSMISSLTIHCS